MFSNGINQAVKAAPAITGDGVVLDAAKVTTVAAGVAGY